MRVYRGRADAIDADRTVSDRLVDRVAADREPAVRVWRPHRQVAFGRRDARAERYETAHELAEERGFPAVEREVGGRAVAYTGSTVAFARVTPVDDPRSGLSDRYDAATADLLAALDSLGVDASEGEPADSFCPGTHSVQADSGGRARKLAGLAQRVRADAAVVAGVLLVRDHDEIASVLDPVYAALDVPFDPETVGSVGRAGGVSDPDAVVAAVESALVGAGTGPTTIERVG
ncbi:lipoate--protein ligase family protein [Halosimplex litoreum]|uniref:Lipoate--protein ligase family protein n=1 Tax=Halosimplex litoreum TaxID=1198301 RepID=A0A7T3KU19_9EURY|nr:lipoate--protein ligase family protein [Halosimplex litoreum]QPV61812.1 lipoate--protein ligase family protein [Halosimplex litoreum]